MLVVKAADRDKVLNEISARAARYTKFDPETELELKQLRNTVRDIFNKGLDPGDDIMEALYFLDADTRAILEKMTRNYDMVVTPDDFKQIAKIMSEHLGEQVPILKDFTRFFGRLAEDFLKTANPKAADFDWKLIFKGQFIKGGKGGTKLPPRVSELLGLKANEPLSKKLLKRTTLFTPGNTLDEIYHGSKASENRRTGAKFFKYDVLGIDLNKGFEVFTANKMPKKWTSVPWVNFDGKVIEQNFTQVFEEKIHTRLPDGTRNVSILQVAQKTDTTWWDWVINKTGNVNDIADATKARTAYAVNGNHSNDAVIVKQFHLWGKKNGIGTSTIHDAFFANAADMLKARNALRVIYADMIDKNPIKKTLDEMLARGLPKELYDQYLNEAIDIGLIPVAGRSKVGGRVLQASDILTKEEVLREVPSGFKNDYGWYGVG